MLPLTRANDAASLWSDTHLKFVGSNQNQGLQLMENADPLLKYFCITFFRDFLMFFRPLLTDSLWSSEIPSMVFYDPMKSHRFFFYDPVKSHRWIFYDPVKSHRWIFYEPVKSHRWIFYDRVKSHRWFSMTQWNPIDGFSMTRRWNFHDERKSGHEPSMTNRWTFYEISMIHRWDLLGAQPRERVFMNNTFIHK